MLVSSKTQLPQIVPHICPTILMFILITVGYSNKRWKGYQHMTLIKRTTLAHHFNKCNSFSPFVLWMWNLLQVIPEMRILPKGLCRSYNKCKNHSRRKSINKKKEIPAVGKCTGYLQHGNLSIYGWCYISMIVIYFSCINVIYVCRNNYCVCTK